MSYHKLEENNLKDADQVNILSRLRKKHEISPYKRNFTFIKPFEINKEHWVSTLTYGKPYLMYLCRWGGVQQTILIEMISRQDSYSSVPKVFSIRMAWSDEAWKEDTVLEGDLIHTNLGGRLFLARDIRLFRGSRTGETFRNRYSKLVELSQYYRPYPEIDRYHFQISKLTTYPKFKAFLHEFIPALPYPCKGLLFYNMEQNLQDRVYLFSDRQDRLEANRAQKVGYLSQPYPRKLPQMSKTDSPVKLETTKPESTKSRLDIPSEYQKSWMIEIYPKCSPAPTIIARLDKTTQPEIYQLWLKDGDFKASEVSFKLITIGYAHIPTLKMSRLIRKSLTEKEQDDTIDPEDQSILVECSFNTEFEKWQPLAIVSHGEDDLEIQPDTYQILTEKIVKHIT